MAAASSREAAACLSYLEQLLRQELQAPQPCVERLSIALGLVELALTPKEAAKRAWPVGLPASVDQLCAAFDGFVAELAVGPALAAAASPQAKVKAVADAIWARLNKGFSKDLLHAQHVSSFAALLLPGGPPPGLKKQLDCAGVVTTTFAACQALALRYPQHADLAPARMQVSEDHCWIMLDPSGSREHSVEVTTDTAAKRGLPVAADAWSGWLYTGGHAVLCSPQQALAALVTSVNPAVTGGKKGVDSEELQAVQERLLSVLLEVQPGALYPAALCALADLREVAEQDALDAARDRGDAAEVARLLQRRPDGAWRLFERAIQLACSSSGGGAGGLGSGGTSSMQNGGSLGQAAAPDAALAAAGTADGSLMANGASQAAAEPFPEQQDDGPSSSTLPDASAEQPRLANGSSGDGDGGGIGGGSGEAGWQWYVYSYLAAYLARRAEFLASCADAQLPCAAPAEHRQDDGQVQRQQQQAAPGGQPSYWQQAVATYRQALQAAGQGAGVLRNYRFVPATDEQLHKDVEGVLEEAFRDGLTTLARRSPGGQLDDPTLLQPLLLLWDGVCWLFAGKPKPSGWVALLMKVAKLFSPEAREAAAAAVQGQVSSGPMLAAQHLWRELKPVPLKPLFESADVASGGTDGSGAGRDRAAKRSRR